MESLYRFLISAVNGVVWGPAMLVYCWQEPRLYLPWGLKLTPQRKCFTAFRMLWRGRRV